MTDEKVPLAQLGAALEGHEDRPFMVAFPPDITESEIRSAAAWWLTQAAAIIAQNQSTAAGKLRQAGLALPRSVS